MNYRELLINKGNNVWMIPPKDRQGNPVAKLPVFFYGNDAIIKNLEDGVLAQAVNVANMDGILHYSNTEDGHIGADCAIGATIGFHAKTGVVAPSLVGSDIACGMRLIQTNLKWEDIADRKVRRALMQAIERRVPTGIGKTKPTHGLTRTEFEEVLKRGAKALLDLGRIDQHDFERIEEPGMSGNPDLISKRAEDRGFNTLCSLGGGNHFLEIQVVAEVKDVELAAKWGLFEGQVVIMLHTGSRGLGFQINEDFNADLKEFYRIWKMNPNVPFIPLESEMGQRYMQAQACAVNFAVANKTLITNAIYESFSEVFGQSRMDLGMKVLYDILHNVARKEFHDNTPVMVIRKGATRALPAGHFLNPPCYKETGHPVIIPGSMGTFSYVLVGKDGGKDNYYTVPHGAGRVMSRSSAKKTLSMEDFAHGMEENDILVNERNFAKLLDEAPKAYKDIDEIMASVEGSGRASVVVKLMPKAVIKGVEEDFDR